MIYKWAIGIVLSIFSYFLLAKGTKIFDKAPIDAFSSESKAYWFDGKAEVASYTLSQNRYAELHNGHAVLIFVSEDFSKSKQVKLDNPDSAGDDKVPVLKMNLTKSFLTGIYPYSIINSVFTPFDLSGTIKTSCSVQEWCGHTFSQLNKTPTGYKSTEYSYFEGEGDKQKVINNAILEDELWTMIRIKPSKLPTGSIQIIRGHQAVRLQHQPCEIINANITKTSADMDGRKVEVLNVATEGRTLTIYYDKEFPHTIRGWDESSSEFGKSAKTTTARLKKTMRLPYWQLHDNQHRIYRDSLGIPN
jgi:hypothetical protein